MSGFEFCETMAGAFRLLGDGRDRPFSFTARARSGSWRSFLKKPEVELEGEIDADGFADHRHMRGTLGMDPVRTGIMPYAFTFEGNDGKSYAFVGKKTVLFTRLAETMTVLPAAIKDDRGATVADALLRFDLRSDLPRFVASFRLAAPRG
jgi:hypothetical protein